MRVRLKGLSSLVYTRVVRVVVHVQAGYDYNLHFSTLIVGFVACCCSLDMVA
jgi:hypothetical protein